MSLAALKKASASNFDSLNQKINALMNPTRQADDARFWQPSVDKAGNGYALIRFLPPPDKDELPLARVWDHGFKGPGGWYIENSRTTLGPDEADPVTEYNSQLWNSGNKADKDIVSGTGKDRPGSKRRLHFYSNILVIEDPVKPENNGKVFLFRYGKRIFDKLNALMNPKFPDQPRVNPFDLWTGANFRLRISNVEGQRSYSESVFDKPEPVANTEAKIEKIWSETHSLKEFTDPKNFKSYAELKAKLDRVLSTGYTSRSKTVEEDVERIPPQSFPSAKSNVAKEETPPWENTVTDDDEGDELAKFRKLIND